MGTWGTAIYSDDLACDIRDIFKELLGEGLSGEQAAIVLVKEYEDSIKKCPEVACPFWLSLAKTQWQYGCMEERIKSIALDIINSGLDLKMWEELGADQKDIERRAKVLKKLKQELESPQPPEKKVRLKFKISRIWDVGDVVSYQLKFGQYCLFRIVDFSKHDDLCCVCELLDWMGSTIPDKEVLTFMPVQVLIPATGKNCCDFDVNRFKLVFEDKKELSDKRLNVVAKETVIYTTPGDGCTLIMWPYLDNLLKEFCGFE